MFTTFLPQNQNHFNSSLPSGQPHLPNPMEYPHPGPTQLARNQWSPYEDNGGTVAVVVGEGCVVLAGDTRISRGYSILKRNVTKMHQLSENCWILSSGMYADI